MFRSVPILRSIRGWFGSPGAFGHSNGPKGVRRPRLAVEELESRRTPSRTLVGDLDGLGGLDVATITESTVRITSYRTGASADYAISRWSSVQLADLDGVPGQELLFTDLFSSGTTPQPATATVVTQRTKTVDSYDVGSPR